MFSKKNIKFFIVRILSFLFIIHSLITALFDKIIKILSFFFSDLLDRWIDYKFNKIDNQKFTVSKLINEKKISFKFYTPNYVCYTRAKRFFYKEPEVLNWINKYGGNKVFFDIGANIGQYSIYYAKIFDGMVYSFEPSVFNTNILIKNIDANNLNNKIKLITNPLSDLNSFNQLNYQNFTPGHSGTVYGEKKILNKNKKVNFSSYETLGLTLNTLLDLRLIKEIPNLVKIDVDGIEPFILKGASKILSNPDCETVYIESFRPSGSANSKLIKEILESYNFKMIWNDNINEIWVK